MIDTVIIMLVVIAAMIACGTALCVLSFLCQFGFFMWICFRGAAEEVEIKTGKTKTDKIENSRIESARERAESGQIYDAEKKEGEDE